MSINFLQDFINDGYELLEEEEKLIKYWATLFFKSKIDSGRKNRQGELVLAYKNANLNTEIKTLDTTRKILAF